MQRKICNFRCTRDPWCLRADAHCFSYSKTKRPVDGGVQPGIQQRLLYQAAHVAEYVKWRLKQKKVVDH